MYIHLEIHAGELIQPVIIGTYQLTKEICVLLGKGSALFTGDNRKLVMSK